MNGFEFPANIKQIGSIGEGLRIYIEDYAFSYLQQYIDTPGYDGSPAFLIGRALVIDSQNVLFISGVVRGMHCETEKGLQVFTAKSFEHARKEIARYFGGLEVVGWMVSRPGFGLRLSPNAAEYHLKTFPDRSAVCLVMDNEEKANSFYIQADGADGSALSETRGFFIYYDKNRPMHEYMLDNRAGKIRVISAEGKGLRLVGETPPGKKPAEKDDGDMSSGEVAVQRIRRNYSRRADSDSETEDVVKNARKSAGLLGLKDSPKYTPGLTASSVRGASRGLRPPGQRRIVNLLMSFSAVLLVVSLVTGFSMVQSMERIEFLEQQVSDLTASHRSLLTEFTNAARPVFADTVQSDNISGLSQTGVLAGEAQAHGHEAAPPDPAASAENNSFSGPAQSPINIEALISQLQETAAAPTQPPVLPVLPALPAPTPAPPVQAPEPPAAFQPAPAYADALIPEIPLEYTIESGDTLSFISRMFYGTTERVSDIMYYNNITDPDSIRVGDTLRLPRR